MVVVEAEMVVATGAAESMPDWVLTSSYALHMLATVIWVGGLIFQALFLLPLLARNSLDRITAKNITTLLTRFQPVAWLSLAVLFGTGLTQMSRHPHYGGLLSVQNRWSLAIFAKHLAILPMLAITGFQTFVLHPRLQREILKSSRSDSSSTTFVSLKHERRLVAANSVLSIVVLILTALARTS